VHLVEIEHVTNSPLSMSDTTRFPYYRSPSGRSNVINLPKVGDREDEDIMHVKLMNQFFICDLGDYSVYLPTPVAARLFKTTEKPYLDWIEGPWFSDEYKLFSSPDFKGKTFKGQYFSGKMLANPHFTSIQNDIKEFEQGRDAVEEAHAQNGYGEWRKGRHGRR
jgi:hypothetical protein